MTAKSAPSDSIEPDSIEIDRAHGGNLGDGILDFSVSINPLGPPPAAIDAYHRAVAKIASYPTPYARRLEKKIGESLGVDADCVLAGNGATQLIFLLARVIRPRIPYVVIPTFSEIANALIAVSSTPRAIGLDAARDFQVSRDAISRALESGADAIFIGRPNSPTGTSLTDEEAAAIGRQASNRNAWCVFDEAFLDFVPGDRSLAEDAARDSHIIILRSLTKIFAIPGLRLGCLISNPDTVRRLRNALEPWSVNVAAEEVGLACLEIAPEFIDRTQRFVAEQRARLSLALARNPRIHVIPSRANFLMIRIAEELQPGDFGRHLIANGIAIRDLGSLPGAGPGFYRIGLRNQTDNDLLIHAISRW